MFLYLYFEIDRILIGIYHFDHGGLPIPNFLLLIYNVLMQYVAAHSQLSNGNSVEQKNVKQTKLM